ncbi:hypothetical protein DXG03_001648 [Asterophora parasitica]|uniref:Uncharacterized protein n=1 Tax=Asterophora parasitica TaxID=117018 RepID=A0A9P7KCN7_9AGAR|nr:hypothetical protein DXG03_001648 [Asterophora parasitica]
MQSSSLSPHFPSTPVSAQRSSSFRSTGNGYRPLNSSPLASPSTPVAAHRRLQQFKSRTPSTPLPSFSRTYSNARTICSSGGSVFGSGGCGPVPVAEDPHKAFLREKFKARCFERAAKAREKAIKWRRYQRSGASSDGFDESMEDDDEEDDDSIMQDELFRRIMQNANRKERHSYRTSYFHDVGSSFDPDMEDVGEWEHELAGDEASPTARPPFELTPVDLDDEELEAYAEECARRAAIADFEDLPQEELFGGLSDFEDLKDDVEMH